MDQFGPFIYSVAAKEEHPETGGYHVHWYACSPGTIVLNNERDLDWSGVHPNIKPINKTPWIAEAYPKKTGPDAILWEEGTPIGEPKGNGKDTWRYVMDAPTKEEFFERISKQFPKEMITQFTGVKAYADWKYRSTEEPYVSPPFTCHCESYPTLTSWVQDEYLSKRGGRRKSLILWGGSLLGKSLWARSLGPHAYFPGLFMLEGFDATSVNYAIFDDMVDGLSGLPNFKYWLGCQAEFVVTDKYKKKTRVKWGKPGIYIANENPLESATEADRSWLEANCIVVHVTGFLAHANNDKDEPIIEKHLSCDVCSVASQ